MPHPNGLARELRKNPEQQANSQYAMEVRKPGAREQLTAEALAGWVGDESARRRYVEAFGRSDFEAMLNYYKANFPDVSATANDAPEPPPLPKMRGPVLMFHGLEDRAPLAAGLNGTWNWFERDLTLVTVPGAGHFVQQNAAELVSATMRSWLLQRWG